MDKTYCRPYFFWPKNSGVPSHQHWKNMLRGDAGKISENAETVDSGSILCPPAMIWRRRRRVPPFKYTTEFQVSRSPRNLKGINLFALQGWIRSTGVNSLRLNSTHDDPHMLQPLDVCASLTNSNQMRDEHNPSTIVASRRNALAPDTKANRLLIDEIKSPPGRSKKTELTINFPL